AKLLVQVQPDLQSILDDERGHVRFFEQQVIEMLASSELTAEAVRKSARAWWRRLPRTLERYLEGDGLTQYRSELRELILTTIKDRFGALGLLEPSGCAHQAQLDKGIEVPS